MPGKFNAVTAGLARRKDQEARPDLPPATDKGQDFQHDHRFGIELRTPF
jgi:hypothetical protein